MNLPLRYRLEAELEMMGNTRRARSHTYRSRIDASKALRNEAVADAHGDFQAMSLPELLKLTPTDLADARVDEKKLQRAAVERHLADGMLRGDPAEEAHFAALSALVPKLRAHTGEAQ